MTHLNTIPRIEERLHDCKIHGLRLISEQFRSELLLDIDYVVQWPDCLQSADEGQLKFKVARATLRFLYVSNCSIHLDFNYILPQSFGLDVFIFEASKTPIAIPRGCASYFAWKIQTNSEKSWLEFNSSDVHLELCSNPIEVTMRQHLTESERGAQMGSDTI